MADSSPPSSPPPAKRRHLEERGNNSTPGNSSTITIPNKHFEKLESDFLYHLGFSREECDKTFSDVKFVVTGGSSGRLRAFATLIAGRLKIESKEISRTDRFAFFKVGPVICVNHGMGVPSITILLHEIIKLLKYSGAVDPVIIRLGTSGGVGVEAGTVVVTNKAFNAFLEEEHEVVVLGKIDVRDAIMDQALAEEMLSHKHEDDGYPTVLGGTLCTDDFYEGQARLDGVACIHDEEEKMEYLGKLHKKGICNIEMECTALASICRATNLKCAVVCVALLNRFNGDQVKISKEDYQDYVQRPQELVCRFIEARLNGTK